MAPVEDDLLCDKATSAVVGRLAISITSFTCYPALVQRKASSLLGCGLSSPEHNEGGGVELYPALEQTTEEEWNKKQMVPVH